jgi:HEAT repeat protein
MKKQIPVEVIERGLQDSNWRVRVAAMNACQSRDIPVEVIERGLQDSDWRVREAAMNACQSRDIPVEVIERGLQDSNWRVREAAMNACQGKDIPVEVIERLLQDSDYDVRAAAINACRIKGIGIPLIRTIEPPETVYKKCLSGVIVCASIPSDAQIRGSKGKKCRTNHAIVTKVIGNYHGEPVGISTYDKTTTYYEGDEIIIDDFDLSDEE